MRQLWTETGESLAIFLNTNEIHMFCVLIILLAVSYRVAKLRVFENEFKSVGL